ncbi:MAG: hypothetical protein RBT49_15580 [Bacteroidales bacterium]|jgi:hypothetical protein|nr:hypothetical protein [Bacteroidales bacterium]
MNKDVERIIFKGYKPPIFKKQDATTWKTLQDKICFECACNIPNSYLVFQDARAIDEDFKTSSDANIEKIKDWIRVFWPDKECSSVFSKNIRCSECGKEIKGEVWFDHNHPNWSG